MTRRIRRIVHLLFTIAIFAIALWAIQRSLAGQDYRDILHGIGVMPASRVYLALLFTGINYLFVAGIDFLAARYAGHPIPYRRILTPSFIGAAFQYNAGVFGGTAVRFRLYSSLGFTPREIGKLMLLVFLTFSVGFSLLAGIALIWDPLALPGTTWAPWWPELAGSALLILSIVYVWLCARGKSLIFLHWHLPLPRFRESIFQILLATCDWIIGACILFVLLPGRENISFPIFVSVFMLAHNVGLASNTPGGLGVFEATVLHLLPTRTAPTEVLAALLAYRGIYYVFPLLLASALLGQREWQSRRAKREKEFQSHWEAIAEGARRPR
jgi:uncharacterized membrane protein YbhN (UPF0104 family)